MGAPDTNGTSPTWKRGVALYCATCLGLAGGVSVPMNAMSWGAVAGGSFEQRT
jgi:hypothetical protein